MAKRKLLYTDEELDLLLPQDGPFFVFDQNNSGGVYRGPAIVVVTIAKTAFEGFSKLMSLPDYDSTYCECCGERWGSWTTEKTREQVMEDLKYLARDDYGMYSQHMKDDRVPLFIIA